MMTAAGDPVSSKCDLYTLYLYFIILSCVIQVRPSLFHAKPQCAALNLRSGTQLFYTAYCILFEERCAAILYYILFYTAYFRGAAAGANGC